MNKYIKMFMNDHNLKVGERFKASGGDKVYYFDDEGKLRDEIDCMSRAKILMCFLWGTYEVEKLPNIPSVKHIPDIGDEYWVLTLAREPIAYNRLDEKDEIIISYYPVFQNKMNAEDYKWFLDKVDEYKKPFKYGDDNFYSGRMP